MLRRDFLKSVAAAMIASGLPASAARSEPSTMATVSSAFTLMSAVTGFMTRGSDPTVPLLVSIAQAVEALNIKLDAIDRKLDLMLEEIFAIRQLVEKLPYQTNLLNASVNLREPYTAFLELRPYEQIKNPSRPYLMAIPSIRDRMRSARIKFLDLANLRDEPGFESVIQLALAQDAELLLAAEMQRPEMHDLGIAEDIRGTLSALEAYGDFFDLAIDPKQAGSLTSLKTLIAKQIEDQLKVDVDLGRPGPTSAWDKDVTARYVNFGSLLDAGPALAVCGHDHSPLCLKYGRSFEGGCAEPGYRVFYDLNIEIRASKIASGISNVEDDLKRPVLYETYSDMICGNLGTLSNSPHKNTIDKAIDELNPNIVNFYKIHYAHGVCELARNINATQQRLLRDLL